MRDAEAPLALGAIDDLTGLRNQRALWRELGRRLAICSPESPLAVVMVDFDLFGTINHLHGREIGDQVLKRAGRVVRQGGTSPRLAFRTGGEEFVLLVPGDEDAGRARAEQLRAEIEQQNGDLPSATVSCGVAALRDPVEPWIAIDRADAALHEAKQAGGNAVVVAGSTRATAEDYLAGVVEQEAPRRAAMALAVASATTSVVPAEVRDDPEDMLTLCEAIGRRLGLAGADLDRLLAGAQLHDVGKVAVPPEIFQKPGRLTPAEYAAVSEHTVIGEDILRTVPEMVEVATIVRYSHEHWDGSGYPDGLAGEDIPLPSRVILCASAFRAMRTERPYRDARSATEAIAELRAYSGTQFDPTVVKALVDVAESVRRQAADPAVVMALPRSRRLIALLLAMSLMTGTAFAAVPEVRELVRSLLGTSTGPSDVISSYTGDGVGALGNFLRTSPIQVPAQKPQKPDKPKPPVAAPVTTPAPLPVTPAPVVTVPAPTPVPAKPEPKPKPKPVAPKAKLGQPEPTPKVPPSGWEYLPIEPEEDDPGTPPATDPSLTPPG